MFNLVTELGFQLLITQEPNTERQVWGKIKDSFVEESFVWGGLTNGCEKKRGKSKGEKGRYKHLNAESQRLARRDKKAFFSDQ